MTRRLTAWSGAWLLPAVLLPTALCGGCAPEKRLAMEKLRAATPRAETVRAYDRPSDDGTTIILQWPKPEKETEGISYVIEIARAPEDFEKDQFKKQIVTPSEKALKSESPRYFGFAPENKTFYYAEIVPAKHFPPPGPPDLDAERLKQLTEEKVLTEAQSQRALAVLENEKPDKQLSEEEKADHRWFKRLELYLRRGRLVQQKVLNDREAQRVEAAFANDKAEQDLSGKEKADRKWLKRLSAYLEEHDLKTHKAAAKTINAATYYFRLGVTDGQQTTYVTRDDQELILSAAARADLFKAFKSNNLVFALAFSCIVLGFIQIARRNPDLFIRKIAGLEAVEEAIGRATEMGRSVYFVHGLGTMGGLSTIAAVNILSRVARRAAEYDTRVSVMNFDAIVTAVSQEVVQQAYTEAGRPDAYNPDDVALTATSQFSYAAAVTGRMVREQPAAIFLMGSFMAESLLLAETGASTGAIQVAGTDEEHQLPFFITTCDYTLIGEELYAASAYLSREPRMLGSLRGQDVGKAFMMLAIILGVILMTLAVAWKLDVGWIQYLVKAL